MKYLIVATKDELELPAAIAEPDRIIIVTGVGATNVIQALRHLPKDSDVLNVGYCGSVDYRVGETVEIGKSKLFHPNVGFTEKCFELSDSETTCLTAGDFVIGGRLPKNSVVDMELAYIAAFEFEKLRAVKYVSDNLNYKEYEECLKK